MSREPKGSTMAKTALSLMIGAVAGLSAGCAPVPEAAGPAARVPAPFPPASFEGRQYVDRDGCVFIRAGAGPGVTWVPRVARDGGQICGADPTLPSAGQAADT